MPVVTGTVSICARPTIAGTHSIAVSGDDEPTCCYKSGKNRVG